MQRLPVRRAMAAWGTYENRVGMSGLYSPPGLFALCQLAMGPALLAFDLDGTLAPLTDCPADAAVPPATAARLKSLCAAWPVAVITGRSVADARKRLGFLPHYIAGNHGAERDGVDVCATLRSTLDPLRERLKQQADALRQHGIALEDKGLSLALHYRVATNRRAARQWLNRLAASVGPDVRAMYGHSVLNLTPLQAPDKGDALQAIMRECGAARSFYIGDDSTDESAFGKLEVQSISVRIAPAHVRTRARFRMQDQCQIDQLLTVLLGLR